MVKDEENHPICDDQPMYVQLLPDSQNWKTKILVFSYRINHYYRSDACHLEIVKQHGAPAVAFGDNTRVNEGQKRVTIVLVVQFDFTKLILFISNTHWAKFFMKCDSVLVYNQKY